MSGKSEERPVSVGRYRVIERLGRGGMSDVFLAKDERLGRKVAIKRLHAELSKTQHRRLEREARAIARLSHPAIVQIFEVLDTDTGEHLVLEFVEGQTAAARLRQGPLDPKLAVRLGREAAGALAEAHAKGILHRDLKAENLVITPHGHAKILDLGLAKALHDPNATPSFERAFDDSLTQSGHLVGTWRAMSPEQVEGGELDARSDLFSLGVLLYEMLTARSPFQGKDRWETLTHLLEHEPPRLSELRAGLPAALTELVGSLLEKDPALRPADAGTVERALERIAAELERAEGDDDFGEAATGYGPIVDEAVALEVEERPNASFRWIAPALGALALLLLLAVAAWMTYDVSAEAARRIAVLEPEIASTDPDGDLALLAAGTLDTALRTLIALDGFRPLDPSELRGIEGGPRAVAVAHAADEALATRIVEAAGVTRIELRRISADEGEVIGSQQVAVSSQPEDALQTAEALSVNLHQAFGAGSRSENFEVQAEDYRAFLEIQQAVRHGNLPFEEALGELGEIVASSPRLSSAHWLIADLAESLYSDTRDVKYLERARRHVEEARREAPGDPRPWVHELRLALLAQDRERAGEALEALERLAPGEPETLYSRALLERSRGEARAAIETLRELVERRPSWRYLYELASLESRAGEIEAARGHLDQLLGRSPGNTWGLGAWVQLELLHGDLHRAEELALELLELKEHRSYWTNLGLARFLLGEFEKAHEAYIRALELDPDHPTVLLNLADTLDALDRKEDARDAYARAREVLDEIAARRPLSPAEKINRAQCSAHLGDNEAAIESTLEVLEHAEEDAELAYQAALVFAVVGDRTSALIKARHALDAGMDLRWFRIPAFREIQGELERPAAQTSSVGKAIPSLSIWGSPVEAKRSESTRVETAAAS